MKSAWITSAACRPNPVRRLRAAGMEPPYKRHRRRKPRAALDLARYSQARAQAGNANAREATPAGSGRRDLLQEVLNDAGGLAEIHLARIALLQSVHTFAHVAQPVRADLRNGLGADFLDLFFGKLLGQELVDDGDFLPLLLGKLRPAALVVNAGRFFALLDHLDEYLQDLIVADRVLAMATIGDVAILDRGLDEADGRDAPGILGLEGFFQCIGEMLAHVLTPCRNRPQCSICGAGSMRSLPSS
ncbi:hypothetical protein EMEDMD4_270114 [Sinorhizobium medicae]|uniref:Uncharacterized protein n=1 Tax=Sinorhizobium medicae TaxID=110321 RepID=A0A508WZH0_9HYPH|nr:hypothetical protein EMEDMD4_270114 [Sinorhizobium medicae]